MQLGFVMQADAAPHDDWRFWPDVVDHLEAAAPCALNGLSGAESCFLNNLAI